MSSARTQSLQRLDWCRSNSAPSPSHLIRVLRHSPFSSWLADVYWQFWGHSRCSISSPLLCKLLSYLNAHDDPYVKACKLSLPQILWGGHRVIVDHLRCHEKISAQFQDQHNHQVNLPHLKPPLVLLSPSHPTISHQNSLSTCVSGLNYKPQGQIVLWNV